MLQWSRLTLLAALLTVLAPQIAACDEHVAQQVQISYHILHLGDTAITIKKVSGAPGLTLVRVHHDESTAGLVGERTVSENGGTYADLINPDGAQRNVKFKLGSVTYRVDPNRIFTPQGIAKTLAPIPSVQALPAVRAAVADFADKFLDLCGKDKPLIALHNNHGTPGSYGIEWYAQASRAFRGVNRTFVHHGAAHRQNFLIVTTRDLYDRLSALGETVVYQVPEYDINDGSMSYYFGQHHTPYVNIEAAFGDETSQARSVAHAKEVLTSVRMLAR